MATIQVQKKAGSKTHTLILTNKWKDHTEYAFSKEEVGYLDTYFKESDKKTILFNSCGRIIAVTIIDSKKNVHVTSESVRKQSATMADQINAFKGKELAIFNATKQIVFSYNAAEGAALGNYQFIKHKPTAKDKHNSLKTISLIGSANQQKVNQLNIVIEATNKARTLVNEPVNYLNATDLSNAFKHFGKDAGFKVEIHNKKKITELKMGGLLSVNAGSVDEPTFSVLEYKPARPKNKKPYVLVGKGVTYDTGGLSLKSTPNSMDMMKCDMAGGAMAGATLYAIAKAKLNIHVIALIPATDNRPGFNAFAPGDIITMMDGSTVEMVNSDAEGRMILADALHFAKRYEPELVIDMATLTGAAISAIGQNAIVSMGNASTKYTSKLKESGNRVFERLAEMPFWDDYNDTLKSEIADQRNLGGAYAGSITAGKFLEKFTNYPYYHLDIAGPAFIPAKDGYRPKGGTGVGVRLLFDFFNSL